MKLKGNNIQGILCKNNNFAKFCVFGTTHTTWKYF